MVDSAIITDDGSCQFAYGHRARKQQRPHRNPGLSDGEPKSLPGQPDGSQLWLKKARAEQLATTDHARRMWKQERATTLKGRWEREMDTTERGVTKQMHKQKRSRAGWGLACDQGKGWQGGNKSEKAGHRLLWALPIWSLSLIFLLNMVLYICF